MCDPEAHAGFAIERRQRDGVLGYCRKGGTQLILRQTATPWEIDAENPMLTLRSTPAKGRTESLKN